MNESSLREPPSVVPDPELRILALLAQGLTADVAADRLGISTRTLRRRTTSARECFGVATTIEAITEAARRGIL